MTAEEIEARMTFIIEQHATLVEADVRFNRQIASLIESDARIAVKIEELADADARVGAKIEELADADARLGVKIEELAAFDARLGTKIEELAEADARLGAKIEELAASDARLGVKIDALVDIQAKSDLRLSRVEAALRTVVGTLTIIDGRMDDWERMRRDSDARMDALTAKLQELAESQKKTEERLNVFIDVLERYIREGRNGKP
jgi:chromosome segregation ATPase